MWDLFFLGIVLILASPVHGQSTTGPTALQASDLLRVRDLHDVTLSPSGRSAAYTIRRAVPDTLGGPSEPAYRSQLRLISASGRDGSQLLTRPDGQAAQPAWHPDGNWLAFVRPVDGVPQIFVLSLTGGEPYQLTDHPYGATQPTWSPSGDRLLFASRLPHWAVPQRTERATGLNRPGRTASDLVRQVPPDTLLVLRHRGTLTPLDTLSFAGGTPHRLPGDTAQTLDIPLDPSVPDRARSFPVDSLRILSPDSLATIFQRMSLIPDTVTVAARPDTAASPDGDPVQIRRWMREAPRQNRAQIIPQSTPSADSEDSVTYRHYFLVTVPNDIMRGDPPRPSPKPLTQGFRSFYDASWLPGGTQVLVSAPGPSESMHAPNRDLYVVDVSPFRLQRLLSIDGYRLTDPQLTSDGTTVAFRVKEIASHYDPADIGLFELDGRSDPKIITGDLQRHVESIQWSPDGWYLYAVTAAPRGRPLYRLAPFARTDTSVSRTQPSLKNQYETSRDTFSLDSTMVDSVSWKRMIDPHHHVHSVDVTDSRAVYAAGTNRNPSELYTNTVSFNNERRLTRHNVQWLRNRQLSSTRPMTIDNEGFSIQARVTKPLKGSASAPHPTVLVPRSSPLPIGGSDPVSAWFQRHYLAGRGYGCVEVWPRGTVAYGERTRWMSFQNWGSGPAQDVRAVADSVTTRPWAADARPFVAGQAYGAYLSAWLMGRSQQFRAGVAQSGVYDLAAFFGEGTGWSHLANEFGGYPWESAPPPPKRVPVRPDAEPILSAGLVPSMDSVRRPARALRQNSPIRFAPSLDAPLLLLHGTADRQIRPSQSERLFNRLRILEQPVEYVRYPSVDHNFATSATPAQRVDRILRWYEFFERFPSAASTDPKQARAQP